MQELPVYSQIVVDRRRCNPVSMLLCDPCYVNIWYPRSDWSISKLHAQGADLGPRGDGHPGIGQIVVYST
jgi:hypothetical protein